MVVVFVKSHVDLFEFYRALGLSIHVEAATRAESISAKASSSKGITLFHDFVTINTSSAYITQR